MRVIAFWWLPQLAATPLARERPPLWPVAKVAGSRRKVERYFKFRVPGAKSSSGLNFVGIIC